MSKFLIDEPFIQVSVSLMLEIGQARAVVLQKLHSLTLNGKPYLATYQDWNELLPFVSYDNFKRILIWLESKNLIISKSEQGKRRKYYSLNPKALSAQGFEIIESSIFHKNYSNKKMSFILPSLVNLVGLTSAIFLQDFYYQNGNNFSQMTQKEINKWIPYVGLRQVEILFRDLQIIEIIKSEFRDESSKHDGKHYSVNKPRIDDLLISSVAEIAKNGESRKRSGGVDNSLIVDNFEDQSRKRSGLKSQKIGTKVAKDRDFSIDQDQVRSFKDNNTNIMGRKPDCGIIPTMKDNIVSLKERLMTFKIHPIKADNLLTTFSVQRIEDVLASALKKEKQDGKPIFGGWIVKALELNWNLKPSVKKEKVMTTHINPENSVLRRELEENTRLALQAIDSVKRSADDVGRYHMHIIRKMLPKTVAERNRHGVDNIVDLHSSSEA